MADPIKPRIQKMKHLRSLITQLELADTHDESNEIITSMRITLREVETIDDEFYSSLANNHRS